MFSGGSNKWTLDREEILFEGKHSFLIKKVQLGQVKPGLVIFFEYKAESSGFPKQGLNPPYPDMYDSLPLIVVTDVSRSKTNNKVLITGCNVNYLNTKFNKGRVVFSLKTSSRIPSKLYKQMVHAYRLDRIQTSLYEIPDVVVDPNVYNALGSFKRL